MSTDEALKYIAEHSNESTSNDEVKQTVEVESKESQTSDQPSDETETFPEPTSDTVDDKDKKEDRQNIETEEGSDEPSEVKDEKADKSKKENKRKDKRDYAFIREKNKRKAQRERYEAEIKSLKDELEKYKGLKLEDFKGDQQQYIDYRIDQQNQERRIADQMRQLDDLNRADMEAENERRVNLSFADEKERQEYVNLLERNGREFLDALQQFDPENVVMSYLNDLEQYPKVLKVLMTDKEALKSVFAKRDPTFRKLALDRLANRILTPKKEKKKLPIIGRQTSSIPVSESKIHDTAYWNEYLRNHPRGK